MNRPRRFVVILLLTIVAIAIAFAVRDAYRQRERKRLLGEDFERQLMYPDTCECDFFHLSMLPDEELPDFRANFRLLDDSISPRDANGIIKFEFGDAPDTVYHPLIMIRHGVHNLNAFRESGDSAYLRQSVIYAEKLLDMARREEGAIYFTVPFDYKVHKRDDAALTAPWSSGMPQGVGLGFFIRLSRVVDSVRYSAVADSLFETFKRPRGASDTWTVFVDSAGCYWIEEYPTTPPSRTLNGFIFSLYGVYWYYKYSGNPEAGEIFRRSLCTIETYLPVFRRPGKVSFYNLTYRHYNSGYHMTHVEQLRMLFKITGASVFNIWADTLLSDYNSASSQN